MAGKRRRKGHPHGKAYGFKGLRPAASSPKTKSSDTQGSDTSSTPTSTSPSSS